MVAGLGWARRKGPVVAGLGRARRKGPVEALRAITRLDPSRRLLPLSTLGAAVVRRSSAGRPAVVRCPAARLRIWVVHAAPGVLKIACRGDCRLAEARHFSAELRSWSRSVPIERGPWPPLSW